MKKNNSNIFPIYLSKSSKISPEIKKHSNTLLENLLKETKFQTKHEMMRYCNARLSSCIVMLMKSFPKGGGFKVSLIKKGLKHD